MKNLLFSCFALAVSSCQGSPAYAATLTDDLFSGKVSSEICIANVECKEQLQREVYGTFICKIDTNREPVQNLYATFKLAIDDQYSFVNQAMHSAKKYLAIWDEKECEAFKEYFN